MVILSLWGHGVWTCVWDCSIIKKLEKMGRDEQGMTENHENKELENKQIAKPHGWHQLSLRISNVAEWIVVLFAIGIIAYLTILVFLFRFNAENSIPTIANLFLQVLSVGAVLSAGWLAGHFLNPHKRLCKWVSALAFAAALAFVGVLSWSYVTQTLLLPESDPKSCFDIALRFYQGEYGAVVPQGSYLSLCPYQTGLIFILEKTMRIFNNTTPLLFQHINCFYLLMIIASGYGTLCFLTDRMEGRMIYLLLMVTWWPLIFNVVEVYGDVPALAWMMFSCMCFFVLQKVAKQWQKTALGIAFAGGTIIACIYKRNCLIYVIALVLVTAVMQLRKFQGILAAMVAATAILSMLGTSFTQKYYESLADNICGPGMPAISYLAMGLQYNGEEAIPGGWNGFHSNTYIATNYSYEETAAISRESIKQSLGEFRDNPGFALHFFHNKVLKQWANQTHGTFWSINGYYDVQRNEEDFWVSYLNRESYKGLTRFEDMHESVVYAILFLSCCIMLCRKRRGESFPFWYMVPVATFIGGFLFSLIWEGQTGAVLYYPILLLPVAIGVICQNTIVKEEIQI